MISLFFSFLAINTGFLFFFVVFLFSKRHALRFWIFIVGYCEIVIFMLLIWQFGWFNESYVTKLIGLRKFESLFNGIYFYVFTLIFVTIQLYINKYLNVGLFKKDDDKKEKIFAYVSIERVDFPQFLKWFLIYFYKFFTNNVIYICYFVILCVSLFAPQNFINAVYLIFCFICITISFSSTFSLNIIKRIWNFLIFFSLISLCFRYIYQFPELVSKINFPQSKWVSMEMIGVVFFDNNFKDLFLNLLPDSVILLFALYQSEIFKENEEFNIRDSNHKLHEVSDYTRDNYPSFVSFIKFLQRLLIIHSNNIIFLILSITILFNTSIASLFLLLITFISFHLKKGTSSTLMGILTLIYSFFFILVSYFFHLPGMMNNFENVSKWFQWFGFKSAQHFWKDTLPFFFLLLFLLVQRYSTRVKRNFYKKGAIFLFRFSPVPIHSKMVTTTFLWNSLKRNLSNLSFFYGINLFAISMLVSAYLHNNVYSIACVFCFGVYVFAFNEETKHKIKNSRKLVLLLLLLQALFLFQYVLLLGPPPNTQYNYYDWNLYKVDTQFFFSVCCLKCDIPAPFSSCGKTVNWYFISDLIAMMVLSVYLINLKNKDKRNKKTKESGKKYFDEDLIQEESDLEELSGEKEKQNISDYESESTLLDNEEMNEIETSIYKFYKSSFNFTLIFIFIAGSLSVKILQTIFFLIFYFYIGKNRLISFLISMLFSLCIFYFVEELLMK